MDWAVAVESWAQASTSSSCGHSREGEMAGAAEAHASSAPRVMSRLKRVDRSSLLCMDRPIT
jgi:hypothetical protein